MSMLIRSMSPAVLAVDEIGSAQDVHAIEHAMHCGCRMLATIHADSMEDLRKKPLIDRMVAEKRFDRYILLGKRQCVGQVSGLFDSRGNLLYREASLRRRQASHVDENNRRRDCHRSHFHVGTRGGYADRKRL